MQRLWSFCQVGFVALLLCAVSLAPSEAQAYTESQTQNQTSNGQRFTFSFTNLPRAVNNTNITVGVRVYGNYGSILEFANITLDGQFQLVAHPGGNNCDANGSNRNYNIGGGTINDRTLNVIVDLSAAVTANACSGLQERVVVTISYTERPTDLTVSAATVNATTTIQAGSQITLSYTIQNGPESVKDNFSNIFYYCRQNNTNNCTRLATQNVNADFNPSQSRNFTRTLTLPNNVVNGQGYIRVWVDRNDNVKESNDNNNDRYASFTVAGQPDLQVHALTLTPTTGVYPSGTLQVAVRIHNAGKARAENFVFRLYLSTDATLDANDTSMRSVTVAGIDAGGYAPSATTTSNVNLTIPSNITPGATLYIIAFVDATTVVSESDENNNQRSASFKVANDADLSVSAGSVAAAGNIGAGSQVAVAYSLLNKVRAFTSNFRVGFFYCRQNNDTNCTRIGSQAVSDNFSADETRSYLQTLTLPNSVVNGQGYIRVWVDDQEVIKESDETNNNRYISLTISAQPDLQVDALTVSPATQTPGGALQVSVRIHNAGKARAENFVVRIFFSADATLGSGDPALRSSNITSLDAGGYAPSATTTSTATVTIPANAPLGSTRYIFAVVDATTVVSESDETNNQRSATFALAALADLSVSAIALNPTTAKIGDSVAVNFRVANAGNANATNVKVRFYYSDDATITTSDTYLGIERTYTINAGASLPSASTTYAVSVTVPTGAKGGTRYIGAIIDWDGQIAESNETNNVGSAMLTVDVPQPDLVAVSVIPAPNQQRIGQSISVAYVIENRGRLNAPGYTVDIYFSTDASITTADTRLARVTQGALNQGQQQTGSQSVTLPFSISPGAGFIGILIDPANAVAESSESNNAVSSAFTAQASLEPPPEPGPEPVADAGQEPTGDPGTSEPTPGDPTPQDTPGNCYTNGCPTGQICQNNACVTDPCTGVTCNADEVCKAGTCTKICGCLTCPAGQKCTDGTCMGDPCANANCQATEICDPSNGNCITNPCATVRCSTGRVCKLGQCVDDPCAHLKCPQGSTCQDGQCLGQQCSEATTENPGTETTTDADADGDPADTTDAGPSDTIADSDPGDATSDAGPGDAPVNDETQTDNNTPDAVADSAPPEPSQSDNNNTPDNNTTNDGGNKELPFSDLVIGGDNSNQNDNTAPATGGCCQINQDPHTPLAGLLLAFLLLLSFRRRTSH